MKGQVTKKPAMKRPAMKKPAAAASRKSFTTWTKPFMEAVNNEVKMWQHKLNDPAELEGWRGGNRWICPMCPTWSCEDEDHLDRLAEHMMEHHAELKHGTRSTKQCRVMAALYNYNEIKKAAQQIIAPVAGPFQQKHYLYESAQIMKQHPQRSTTIHNDPQ